MIIPVIVRGWRTRDSAGYGRKGRMFAADKLAGLQAEADDLENRMWNFISRVQQANAERPGRNGFYSPGIALLSCRCRWLARVKQWLQEDNRKAAAQQQLTSGGQIGEEGRL